jgi:SAM-dependent methyltransferase
VTGKRTDINKIAVPMIKAMVKGGRILKAMGEAGERQSGHGDQKSVSHRATPIPTLTDLGFSRSRASRWQTAGIVPDDQLAALIDDIVETDDAILTNACVITAGTAIIKQQADDELLARFNAIKSDLPLDLHVGDFRDLSPKVIADGTVDLVFTDPPYDDDSIPLFEAAAKEAARILKPGGSLITYCGHLQLPAVLKLMSAHLKYYWIGGHVHDGGLMARMMQFGIIAGWKPLLWYVKDYRADRQTFITDTVLVKREKDTHPWQQAVATAEHFIAGLTSEGATVVDFFAGGGTTIIAAKNLGRRWIAFEIDEKAIPGIVERGAAA